jgi:hypothetical protein
MKIERTAEGSLHIIDGAGARTFRFESFAEDPLLQFLASMSEEIEGDGYNVERFARAKITLILETEDEPDYGQQLS